MTDMTHVDPMIQAILRADHLSEEKRIGYSKRFALIAAAARNKGLDPASAKSVELDFQELHGSWHPENYDCSCPCSI